MKLYSSNDDYKLYNGSMLDMLEVIEPNTIDSIVTDPPYGLTSITKRFGKENSAECQYGKDGSFQRLSRGFMGKEWDGSGIEYNIDTWKKCYEVLKPGGYLLAFGGSRTFHRIACAIEDAGFEIRDTIMWLYGSGFPKSMNIGLVIDKKNGLGESQEFKTEYEERIAQNEWQGWGTALKPSFEPIIVARKPFKGSLVDNVIEYGVGGLNIDECRVAFVGNENTLRPLGKSCYQKGNKIVNGGEITGNHELYSEIGGNADKGRFPANTILTYDETDFDEVCGGFPITHTHSMGNKETAKSTGMFGVGTVTNMWRTNDKGSASRYFYCAKASKKDRDEGLDTFTDEKVNDGRNKPIDNAFQRGETLRKNTHPTVKPTELMQYLVRLVSPKGATILDPFNGSGSTGKAVMYENKERNANYKYIGIDLSEEYLAISKARIDFAINDKYSIKKNESSSNKVSDGQLSIFTDVDKIEQESLFREDL